jgi:AsmA-like C-terminal region
MQVFKKISGALLLLILLAAGTLTLISIVYENEVKNYMIRQLNARLKTRVIVDSKNITFSLFTDFPYASLSFKNISMLEAPVDSSNALPESRKGTREKSKLLLRQDTLFSIDNISFQFNILDILGKKYVVKKFTAANGILKLRSSASGIKNWDVWKNAGNGGSSGESAFSLEKFKITNLAFSYANGKTHTAVSGLLHSGRIAGDFASKKYDLSINGDLLVDQFSLDGVRYLEGKPLVFALNLNADNDKNQYTFHNAEFAVSDMKVVAEGTVTANTAFNYMNIFLKGKDMDVQSLLSLLPEKYHHDIRDYNSDGDFYFNAHIEGKMDDTHSPEVKADFGISNADITQLSSGIALKNVHVIGNYFSSGSSANYFLDLKTFSASLENGRISGNIRIDNFSTPRVSLSLNAAMLLEDVRRLFKINTLWNYPIQSLGGIMKVDMHYKGNLSDSGKYTRADFQNMKLSGNMALENAAIKLSNSQLVFDSINGFFILNDNNIAVNFFKGKTQRSDFYMKGLLKNILTYTFSDEANLNAEATFQSVNFDLNEFLLNQQQSSLRDTVYNIHFSPRINFTLNSSIGRLAFRKFEAENIRGVFQLRNQKLIADPISFSAMDGSVVASGMVDGACDTAILVTCDASLKKLSISKLFDQFEDFDQHTMTHNNIRGIGTATIQFASVWKSDLSVDLNRIYMRTNLAIEKGELIKFEPIKALSKYIAVAELEDIKFPFMQNQIEIKGQRIIIPKMYIQSSALDLTLSGTHTFTNQIDYHVQVLMSDILFQKARKAKKENNEFGVVEDDKSGKTSLFISMIGTVDNPVFKYDRQEAKQKLKENIKEEKHSLKQILKDEFGFFKKDTALSKKKNKVREDGKFIIDWGDDEKGNQKKEKDDF